MVMKMSMLDELDYICKLNYDIFNVPICFINNVGECIINHSESKHTYPIYSYKDDFLKRILLIERNSLSPVIWESNFYGNFASIHFKLNNDYIGSIIVGPILYSALTKESIDGLFNDLNISITKEKLVQYYDSISILSKWDLTNLIQSIYFMVYKEKLLLEDIFQEGDIINKETSNIGKTEVHIAERRQNLISYADPMIEEKVIDCVKNGKTEELENIFYVGNKTGRMGVLDKRSHLRSQKNLAIVGIAIATRASIDGGLHPEIAYTLSDLFIQHVEELEDSKLVMRFLKKAFLEFTDRIKKNNKRDFTKPINLCVIYIYSHLYEDLNLETLADVSKVSPSYLSSLFKEEVGIPLSEYIQQSKVEEAINLLTYTDHSLLEISSFLNFNDQSYFTKVFKRYTGFTPNQYRRGKKKQ